MRINTNVMALNAQNMLSKNQGSVEKSVRRLSSGLRINGASDDAAGLAISEKMRVQVRGLGQAQDNAQDGISLLQTAEGALQQTTDILQRMRELVIKAQNTGVLTNDDRTSISNEIFTLRDEVDRIANATTFNSKKLLNGDMAVKYDVDETQKGQAVRIDVESALASREYNIAYDGTEKKLKITWDDAKNLATAAYSDISLESNTSTFSGKVNFTAANVVVDYGDTAIEAQNATVKIVTEKPSKKAEFKVGANVYEQDILSLGIKDMSSSGLNRTDNTRPFEVNISSIEEANKTLKAIDYAINLVSEQRSKLGTAQNRMEYASNNLSTTEENLTAAESRIRDVDMAEEMVTYTKNSILNESAMAMLSQANKQPETILTLLQ